MSISIMSFIDDSANGAGAGSRPRHAANGQRTFVVIVESVALASTTRFRVVGRQTFVPTSRVPVSILPVELATFHSITSSAATSNVCGIARPSAFAVLRLTTSSKFTVWWTGRAPGFSRLTIDRAGQNPPPAEISSDAERPTAWLRSQSYANLSRLRPVNLWKQGIFDGLGVAEQVIR